MDRSLDEIIGERPRPSRGGRGGRGGGDRRGPPPARAPRREEYPRDGVRKYRRDEPTNLDSEWVHDRFEEDRYDRRRGPIADGRGPPRDAAPPNGTRVRVDNIHYELTEDDLRELFERIGPVESVRLLYDRADRSQGTAFVIYEDHQDARDAVRDFDGCNANGQPIRLTMMPSGPAPGGPRGAPSFDKPPRSLFDRIEGGPPRRGGDREDGGRRRRNRSDSPHKAGRLAPPEDVDRYVPGRGSRSPIRRRGTPREPGRRPGAKREDTRGGGARRGGRTDEEGRPLVGGRPRKTAEELDAEMNDYWESKGDAPATDNGTAPAANGNGDATGGVGDIDMDI